MKILVTPRSYKNDANIEARTKLENFADEIVAVKPVEPLSEEELIRLLDGCDGYIAGLDNITDRVIKSAKQLKVISRWGVGYDKVDLKAAREQGVAVTYTPGTNSRSVAELVLGLMISCARDICGQNKLVHDGEWPNQNGMELLGKKIGIIGFGAIGRHLGEITSAIGMQVYAYDPYFNEEFAKEKGIRKADVHTIIKECDFISLHVPVTVETKNMIGAEEIASMKEGAILINAARGGLVDEQAAADALRSGKLAAAAFDAFVQEPPVDSPLKYAPNVIMLPHTGAHTFDSVKNMGMMAVENVIAELSGRDCGHRVE